MKSFVEMNRDNLEDSMRDKVQKLNKRKLLYILTFMKWIFSEEPDVLVHDELLTEREIRQGSVKVGE